MVKVEEGVRRSKEKVSMPSDPPLYHPSPEPWNNH